MSPVRREWLVQGCMRLSDDEPRDRVSLKIRELLSRMHGGAEFRLRSWPQRVFRDTLWWSEQSVAPPQSGASYCLKTDIWRGPNLYAGITVEKGFEDETMAREDEAKYKLPRGASRLGPDWDWHRFIDSLGDGDAVFLPVAQRLQAELYLWLEFLGADVLRDRQYYVIKEDGLYPRGGFKPVSWDLVRQFVCKPRPRMWGGVFLVRAFALQECTPTLSDGQLMRVFEALRCIRDLWRGPATPS